IVEINCHGGIHTVNRVLQLTLKHGARMAEPGEFTKRALLNGRIDLSQAEGVMDFIRSKTTEASKVANQQMQGRLKTYVESLRQSILNILAQVEVNIDIRNTMMSRKRQHRFFWKKRKKWKQRLKNF